MSSADDVLEKILTRNDTGQTGAHQAGLHIPKVLARGGFFPILEPEKRNPRVTIRCLDAKANEWALEFIYYNNRRFGGTRDEYRLTCMTPFTREHGLVAGDVVGLRRLSMNRYQLYTRSARAKVVMEPEKSGVLMLRGGWKVIRIKGR